MPAADTLGYYVIAFMLFIAGHLPARHTIISTLSVDAATRSLRYARLSASHAFHAAMLRPLFAAIAAIIVRHGCYATPLTPRHAAADTFRHYAAVIADDMPCRYDAIRCRYAIRRHADATIYAAAIRWIMMPPDMSLCHIFSCYVVYADAIFRFAILLATYIRPLRHYATI